MQPAFVTSCHLRRDFSQSLQMLWGGRAAGLVPKVNPHTSPQQHPVEGHLPTANSPGLGFLELPGPSLAFLPFSPRISPGGHF